MSFLITCIAGDAVPQQLQVDEPIEAGRDPHCDLRLIDESASRSHARLVLGDGCVQVEDLGSANGCLIDGERVAHGELRDGSRLRLGNTLFVCSDSAADPGATRVHTDKGAAMQVTAEQATRQWRSGDDPEQLPALHDCLQACSAAPPAERGAALARALTGALRAHQAAVVQRGRVQSQGLMSERLAQRLAGGDQARLLGLGKELHGQTIAQEAIGSALSAPLGRAGYLVCARGIDEEAFDEAELALCARIAAEAAPQFAFADDEPFARLIGQSSAMQRLRARIRRVASADAAVLITGASGTGKEEVARALHAASGRAGGPLVSINCAAIAESLFEAELFGHEQGAFTGADRARPGRFRQADGGCLFLDEIGELSEAMQAKLLRVLQEGQVETVGGGQATPVDVRVIAASNRDLQRAVDEGAFRADLFYRLDVIRLHTPDLADRSDDIPELARHLLMRAAEETGLVPLPIADAALHVLSTRAWPGNVRQLGNTLTRALVLADERIEPQHLELDGLAAADDAPVQTIDGRFPTLDEMTARHVAAALKETDWNKTRAAKLLGVSRPTILKKIADYGLVR